MYLNIKCKAVKFFYENIGYDLYKLQIRKRFLFFSFLFFYCYSITVVCLFSPSLHPTPGESTSFRPLHPPPWFCPCVLYSSSCNPLYPLSSFQSHPETRFLCIASTHESPPFNFHSGSP